MVMNIFTVYTDTLRKNYTNYEGRATRSEYWLFFLANTLVGLALGAVGVLIGFPLLVNIYGLAVICPGVCIGIRRLHDIGQSGWWLLLCLTGIGSIVVLVFYCLDSQPYDNQFGPNPKGSHPVYADENISKQVLFNGSAEAGNYYGNKGMIADFEHTDGGINKVLSEKKEELINGHDEDPKMLRTEYDEDKTLPLFGFEMPKPGIAFIRKIDNKRFDFKGDIFTIGSSDSKADYNITTNKRVSRNHATVFTKNELFYIRDNSKNGTFVNGAKLKENETVLIRNGDTVAFADEEYTVRIN